MRSSIKRTYQNNKTARPFLASNSLHIVMRSEIAKGDLSLLASKNKKWLRDYLPRLAKRFSIRLYQYSNNGNHLHLVVQSKEKRCLISFLRVLSGVISRKVMGAEKGKSKGVKFWSQRPYSRIISWGREFWNVMQYVERNLLEARGALTYLERGKPDLARKYLFKRAWLNQRELQLPPIQNIKKV